MEYILSSNEKAPIQIPLHLVELFSNADQQIAEKVLNDKVSYQSIFSMFFLLQELMRRADAQYGISLCFAGNFEPGGIGDLSVLIIFILFK